MKAKCPNCKRKFKVALYRIKESKTGRVCCSSECWWKWRSKIWIPKLKRILKSRAKKARINRSCEWCTKKFSIAPAHTRSFCSRECYRLYMGNNGKGGSVYIPCLICNVKFRMPRYRFEKKERLGIKNHFCGYPCYRKYWMKEVLRKIWLVKPNKVETSLSKILKPFGFKYVGNGAFLIGSKNPDFINKKTHKVIELFGEHWHEQSSVQPRVMYFRKRGYDCMVIWVRSLQKYPSRTLSRIERFSSKES